MNLQFLKRAMLLIVAILSMNILTVSAQKKIQDSAILGVWYMEYAFYEGEVPLHVKDMDYVHIKIFRANGKFAMANIYKTTSGLVLVRPLGYSSYSMKNGVYTENGKIFKWEWLNDYTYQGGWRERKDQWKKIKNCPKEVEDYIFELCRLSTTPEGELRKQLDETFFSFE